MSPRLPRYWRMGVAADVCEAGAPEGGHERSGQDRVGEVTVPGPDHAAHPFGVGGMPRQRRPIDVPDDDAATWPDDAHQLGERGVDIAEVLEDLDGDRAVDGRVAEWELRRLALEQTDVRPVAGLPAGDGEHRRARVHAGDHTVLSDDVEDVNDVEPGPAADVKHLVAGLGSQCFLGERAAPFDVARAVDDLELRRGPFVEIHLIS